jgi:Tfp pilus assembly protein PilF
MVQRRNSAWPQAMWPALILLNVVLAVSASSTRAQQLPQDDSLGSVTRVSHSSPFGRPSGQISGTVSYQGDAGPAPGVAVTVRSVVSSERHAVVTDLAGYFKVDGLSAGPYTVTAEAGGYESASSNTSVDRGTTEVNLYLKSVNSSTSSEGMPPTVSVHELRIPTKAQDFFAKGLQRLEKDPDASALYFTKAIDKYSDYYEAYYELGQAQVRLNHTKDAIKSFQTAIDLSGGKFAPAQFAYGLLLCKQGNAQEAERVVRRGLESDSNMPYGHLALGVVLLRLHRPVEAEKSAKEVLLRNPNSPDAYLVLADSHSARANYAAEVNDLDAFLKLVPEGPRREFAQGLRNAAQRLAVEVAQGPQSSQIPQRPDVLNIQPTKP